MEYFISAFWSLLELISSHFFWCAFLPQKTSKAYIWTFVSAWLFTLIYQSVGLEDIYEQAISFAMLITIALINYRGSFVQKILFVFLVFIFGAIIDTAILYGTSALLNVSLSDLVWRKKTYIVIVTAGKLITILMAWVAYRIRKERKLEPIQRKWLLLTLLFPAVSLSMLALIFNGNREQGDLSLESVCISIIVALANVAIIYLIHIMEKSTAEMKKLALLNQQMDIQTNSILTLEKNYRAQRKATHEHRNQLQTIHDLLLAGEYNAAQSYVQQLQGMQTTRIFTINSRHPIIDAVLNQKYQLAQENDIEVQVKVNDLSGVSIPTDSLVVLLSNLLDNAIEACMRLPDKRIIQCSILETDLLYVSVRNTSVPVIVKNNYIPTTKEPPQEHGYGLPHIELILNHLKAEFILSYENGWFEFATEIPHN